MQQEAVLAVDPGREKCGIAVVHRTQGTLYKAVVPTGELAATAAALVMQYRLTTVIIGNSTSSRAARKEIGALTVQGEKLTMIPVDEYRSTDQARKRYWADHPPRGLKRLLPTGMQVPPVPVDDYAAVVLAERYFAEK